MHFRESVRPRDTGLCGLLSSQIIDCASTNVGRKRVEALSVLLALRLAAGNDLVSSLLFGSIEVEVGGVDTGI